MEPLKPEREREILANAPKTMEQELAEYEQLRAKRYRKDPSIPLPEGAQPDPDEARLEQLHKKLFGE